MTKVLILHDRLSNRGGSDRYLLDWLAGLKGRVESRVAVGRDDGTLTPAERAVVASREIIPGLDACGRPGDDPGSASDILADLVRDWRPDLIHLFNILDPALIRTAANLGPTLATIQDHRHFCPGQGKLRPNDRACAEPLDEHCLGCFRNRPQGEAMLGLALDRLDALKGVGLVTVLSDYMARELIAAGLNQARVRVIGPVITPRAGWQAGKAGAGEYHLLAGRLVRRKGVRVALEAALRMENGPPLLICGSGPLAAKVGDAAEKSGGRIRLGGWVEHEELGRIMARATSVWVPSLWAEPFGLVGPEAMAHGVPVIGCLVGGTGEWLRHWETGLAIRPGSVSGLAKAAGQLAADPDLRIRLGQAGQDLVASRFSEEVFQKSILAAYRDGTRLFGLDSRSG